MALNKKDLEHLAKLARLELDPKEEEKILSDLDNILNHFKELEVVNTDNVIPMSGGTTLKNVVREDAERVSTNQGKGKESFPESQRGFLKVPPVFSGND